MPLALYYVLLELGTLVALYLVNAIVVWGVHCYCCWHTLLLL